MTSQASLAGCARWLRRCAVTARGLPDLPPAWPAAAHGGKAGRFQAVSYDRLVVHRRGEPMETESTVAPRTPYSSFSAEEFYETPSWRRLANILTGNGGTFGIS